MRSAALLASLACATACSPEAPPAAAPAAAAASPAVPAVELASRWETRVLATWPHDPTAFTQGLLFRDGRLLESLGLYGRSELRRVELETGLPIERRPLPATWFGEGLAWTPRGLVQLTWREGIARRWDEASLQPAGEFRFEGEGWGLAWDGGRLIQSDGTARLTLRDGETFEALGSLEVHDQEGPVPYLNELEWVGSGRFAGLLLANVLGQDRIVAIDMADGRVRLTIDAGGLLDRAERSRVDVLNGIAFDPAREVFYLTGKLWPRLFEVTFEPIAADQAAL